MIETPEKNIVLSFEQQNHLNTFQNKLANLEGEIVKAQKNLKGIKMESERATKEKEYNEELLSEIGSKIEKNQNQLKDIKTEKELNEQALHSHLEQSKTIQQIHTAKTAELTEREKSLFIKEEEHIKKVDDFIKESHQLLKDQLAVKNAQDAFLKASDTITWSN